MKKRVQSKTQHKKTKHFVHLTSKNAFDAIFSFIGAFFIILTLVALLINPFFSIFNSVIESNPDQFQFGIVQTKQVTQQALNYLWFGTPLQVDLSEQAISHMSDVRFLFIIGQILLLLLLVLFYLVLRKKTRLERLSIAFKSAFLALILLVLFAIISFFWFENLFTFFHKVFFTNELWLFPPNDTLILYFPQYFFFVLTLRLTLLVFFILCVLVLYLKRKEQ